MVNDPPLSCFGATYWYVAIEVNFFPNFKLLTIHSVLNNILKCYLMLFLLSLYNRKQINYDLSDCLHASVTELRHICISKRWGSKLPLMKAGKVNINKRILKYFMGFLHCSICSPYGEIKNCGIPAWYQYSGRNPMTLQKCRSFCVLN